MPSLYEKTGLSGLKWEEMNNEQQLIIEKLVDRKNDDWFGKKQSHAELWETAGGAEKAPPFDMRLLVPTLLTCELNGFNGRLFEGVPSSYDLYHDLYDVKWPVGCELRVEEYDDVIIVDFDTPWCAPSQNVFEKFSELFQCSVTHRYSEAGMGFCGFAVYKNGFLQENQFDDIQYGEPNEDDISDVVGPDYILGQVAHYGG